MAKTILIVEDNELNMKLFNDLLQAHGYETVQTMDGRDVLQLAREYRRASDLERVGEALAPGSSPRVRCGGWRFPQPGSPEKGTPRTT